VTGQYTDNAIDVSKTSGTLKLIFESKESPVDIGLCHRDGHGKYELNHGSSTPESNQTLDLHEPRELIYIFSL